MTDAELGEKIELAARLLDQARGSMPYLDLTDGTRWSAREQLGKVVREILTEGIRTWLDTLLYADQTKAPES